MFADLVGFTALTEAHGDAEAIEIAIRFAERVEDLLADYESEQVKTIGDEVMIRVDNPVQAVRLGLRIVEELAHPGSPPVRVGMHSGAAVGRNGDWFGGTVNLASRVAGAARAGEVLLTADTRREVGEPDGVELEEAGARHFRHIPDPVIVYRAVGAQGAGHHLEIDPVCRMAVDPRTAAGGRRRRGLNYYFCSSDCQRAFEAQPRRYIASSPAARAARKGFLINLSAFVVFATIHFLVWALAPQHPRGSSGMLALYAAWAIALIIHYRTVHRVF